MPSNTGPISDNGPKDGAGIASTEAEPLENVNTSAPADMHNAEKPGIISQVRQTIDESKDWLEAELAFQQVRLRDGGQRVKTIAILMGAGIVLFLCAFMCVLLGIFLTVTYYFGPLIALLTVPLAFGIFGYISFRMALSKMRNFKDMVRSTGGITGLKTEADDDNETGTTHHGEPQQ